MNLFTGHRNKKGRLDLFLSERSKTDILTIVKDNVPSELWEIIVKDKNVTFTFDRWNVSKNQYDYAEINLRDCQTLKGIFTAIVFVANNDPNPISSRIDYTSLHKYHVIIKSDVTINGQELYYHLPFKSDDEYNELVRVIKEYKEK